MSAGTLLIGHAGHWLVSLSYFIPVIAFLGWLAYITIRDRMRRNRGERE